jgi:hypothetical protein
MRDRFGFAVRNDFAVIPPVRQLPESFADLPELPRERFPVQTAKVADGLDAHPLKFLVSGPADSSESADRQRVEKFLDLIDLHDHQRIWLLQVATCWVRYRLKPPVEFPAGCPV